MKYIKYLLITLLLVPFIVLAETKNVEIKSISNYVDKSDAAEELEKPNIEGLKLGFKLKFTKQDDFIKYKFIIKNNTDKDYEIDNSSTFNEKKFIRYDYEVENNAKVLKANEELSINVTITYVKELDDSEFENGVFTETNQVSLELVNDSNEVIDNPIIKMATNPETSTGYILLAIIAIILSLVLILFISNKKAKLFLLTILLLIPITIYALERIKIDVETYVEIENYNTFTIKSNICASDDYEIHEFKFTKGMTFNDFINHYDESQYAIYEKIFISNLSNYFNNENGYLTIDYHELEKCMSEVEEPSEELFYNDYEEYERLADIAMEKKQLCTNKFHKEDIGIDSIIENNKKATYYYINNDKCLE